MLESTRRFSHEDVTMVSFLGTWYDLVWTAVAVVNVALVVVALRRLTASVRLDGLVKFGLALLAIFVPFIGPGLVLLVLEAASRSASATPAG